MLEPGLLTPGTIMMPIHSHSLACSKVGHWEEQVLGTEHPWEIDAVDFQGVLGDGATPAGQSLRGQCYKEASFSTLRPQRCSPLTRNWDRDGLHMSKKWEMTVLLKLHGSAFTHLLDPQNYVNIAKATPVLSLKSSAFSLSHTP